MIFLLFSFRLMLLFLCVSKVGMQLTEMGQLIDIHVCSMDIVWQELETRMKEYIQTSQSLQNQDHSGPWCILAKYIYCFKQLCLLFLRPCIPTCKIFSKGIQFMARGGEKKVNLKSRMVVKIKYFSPVNFPESLIIKQAQETGCLVQPSNQFLQVQNESYEDSQ